MNAFQDFWGGGIDFPSLVFPFRCSCEKQPVLGALPLAEPDVDDAAPGSSGAFSFLLRPPCRLSFFCPGGSCRSAAPSFPLTAFLLWPSPSRRGPRTAKGGLIDHLTCSSSVFIHPSASTFSLTPLFFFFLRLLICTALSDVTMVSYCRVHCVERFVQPFTWASHIPLLDFFPSNHFQTASAAFWSSTETERFLRKLLR